MGSARTVAAEESRGCCCFSHWARWYIIQRPLQNERIDMNDRNPNPPYKRIATEEAWAPPELIRLFRKEIEEKNIDDPGFHSLWGFFAGTSEKARAHARRIQDLGEIRIKDMDDSGIDMQVVSLTSPGVQLFDPATATSLAERCNDELAEGVARNPGRFVGLA